MWSETGSVRADRCSPRGALERSCSFRVWFEECVMDLRSAAGIWDSSDQSSENTAFVRTNTEVRRSLTWRRRYAALLMRLISVQRVMGESLGLCGCEELVMRRLNTSASLRLTADAHYTRAPKLNSSDRLRWFKQLLYYTEFGFYCIAALLLVQWNISKTWYYCSTLSRRQWCSCGILYLCKTED